VAPADRLAVVQPGVVNKTLRDAVAGAGLFYPPDPIKVDWLEREIGPVALDVHRAIKDALDPAGLLNPDKVFRRAAVADLAAVAELSSAG
jgi:FAD/FMN-containing dehydrogenase